MTDPLDHLLGEPGVHGAVPPPGLPERAGRTALTHWREDPSPTTLVERLIPWASGGAAAGLAWWWIGLTGAAPPTDLGGLATSTAALLDGWWAVQDAIGSLPPAQAAILALVGATLAVPPMREAALDVL